ncbi:MAG: ATP:cob(I)alamin adenosyltransferase, partial [Anaerolineaceae bacterium]
MASFFTRKGDDGTTGMLGKERINKFDLRMETLGTLDEVSAVLGLARSKSNSEETKTTLLKIQRELYLLMAETAATKEISETF